MIAMSVFERPPFISGIRFNVFAKLQSCFLERASVYGKELHL